MLKGVELLILTAKAIHLSGEENQVRGVFDLDGGSIGRGAECDLVLPDPNRRISRTQARVSYDNGSYLVINASTSNPMYVNGVELAPGSSQTLNDGDELRAGSYVLSVQHSETETDSRETAAQAPVVLSEPLVPESLPVPASVAGTASADIDALIAVPSTSLESDSSNPFADLLASPVPIPDPTQALPSAQAQRALTDSDVSGAPAMLQEVPLLAKASAPVPAFSPAPGLTAEPFEMRIEAPPAGRPDLADPFADLLAEAAPLNDASGPHASSQDGLLAGLPAPTSTRGLAPDNREANAIPDPFALAPRQKAVDDVDLRRNDDGLSRLAGDPFSDLMGAPVQVQMANLEPASGVGAARASANYIPNDFNPMALQSLSDRNSADPLGALGLGARGLEDVLPHSSVDSIFDPRNESSTTLAVDPLSEASSQVMQLSESVDPMRLFNDQASGLFDERARLDPAHSVHNHAREMAAFFRPPVAVDEYAHAAQARQEQPLQPSVDAIPGPLTEPGAEPTPVLVDEMIKPFDFEAIRPSSPQPDQSVAEPLAPVQMSEGVSPLATTGIQGMARGGKVATGPPPAAAVQRQSSGHAAAPDAAAWIAAFQKGAGLQALPADSITPELMETIGRMMSIATQGMVDLLAGRAAVKQEVHLSVTLINPRSNNPLKFLPDGHTAMLQMLGPRMPGFMPATQAMEEAVQDLVTHQSAIAAGTQATIEALFRRFDPVAIETSHPQAGVGEKMSRSIHRARLWGVYLAQYRQIRDEVKDGFFKRLGAEFQDAYNKEYGRDKDENV